MNILLVAKMGAAVAALFIAYWIGLNDGKNSEELKNARVTISALDTALQEQQAKQKSDALALSNLRIAESRSRDELDRLRQQLSEIERTAKTDADRQRNRCLRNRAEVGEVAAGLLRAVKFCQENHK